MDDGGVLDIKMAHIILYCFLGSIFSTGIIGLCLIAIHFFKWTSRKSTKNYLIPSFISFFSLVLIWFLPFAFQTFQWIYRTSLGDVALSTGSLSGAQFSWHVLNIYLREEGLLAVSIISIIAILGSITLSKQKRLELIFSQPVIYLLLLTPFPIWEAFYTVQIVTRKLSIAFPAILMALLIIGLQKNNGWRLRINIIAALLFLQFILLGLLSYTKDYRHKNALLNNAIGYFVPQPSTINPNPHDVVIDFFNEQAQKYHLKSIGLEVIPGTPDARHPIEAEPINPFLLSMMLAATKSPYYANYLYFSDYSPSNLTKIHQQYDAIFLSDQLGKMKITPDAAHYYKEKYSDENNPSLKTFYRYMTNFSSNQLLLIGWKLGPCITISTQNHGNYRGCLLLNEQLAPRG